MNTKLMNKEVREDLARKYFWKQKRQEIKGILIGIGKFTWVLSLFLVFLFGISYRVIPENEILKDIFRISLYVAAPGTLIAIVYGLRKWIKNNWKKAYARVDKEIEEQLKKRKLK